MSVETVIHQQSDSVFPVAADASGDDDDPGGRSPRPGSAPDLSALAEPTDFQPAFRPGGDVSPPPRRRGKSAFQKAFFPAVPQRDWNDWRWQSRNRITSHEALERVLVLSAEERDALVRGGSLLPIGVTPYYLSLVSREDAGDPLRRTIVPVSAELERLPGEADDPLGEEQHMAAPGVVHRYPDRVLFLVLDFCSTYCRYCTRSRVVGHGEITPSTSRLEAGLDYIRRNPQIRDVLLSGGDPLSLSDDRLDWILTRLRQIPHVQFVRIGTKMPAVLPQRITPQLVRMLRRHHPLWLSLHFMHPNECTAESYRACARLADAGIPLGAQIVLTRDVNDDVEVMKRLVHHLLMMRVRPYYLYQCDPISGSAHFRTSVRKGLEIIAGLRGFTTGYAVPTFVVDAPGGGGKIPLQPDYVVGWERGELILRNFEGKEFRYPDPAPPGGNGDSAVMASRRPGSPPIARFQTRPDGWSANGHSLSNSQEVGS